MIRLLHESRNGIDPMSFKVSVYMDKSCSLLEDLGRVTKFDDFKYRDLEEKLNYYLFKYDKLLLHIPFGQLERRRKQLTEKMNFKIEKTSLIYDDTASYDKIDVVLTR